jgi:hypothetical protein
LSHDDPVTTPESRKSLERIFDRLDRIDARLTGIETELHVVKTDVAYLRGRVEQLPGYGALLIILIPVAFGLFIGLSGAVWALVRLTTH